MLQMVNVLRFFFPFCFVPVGVMNLIQMILMYVIKHGQSQVTYEIGILIRGRFTHEYPMSSLLMQ